jgi:hypothetical protein
MRIKILIAALAAIALQSCGTHCQSNKWRNKRFVEASKTQPAKPSPARIG